MLLYRLSYDGQWQESKCVLQEIYRALSLPGVWERTCLVWCTLQILRETCHTSFAKVFETSIKHTHKKLCRHQFISAAMCCALLLWLQGTALGGHREDQETLSLPQGPYGPVAFLSMLSGDLNSLSQTALILYLASSVNLLESWKLRPSHYKSSFPLTENFLFLKNPR